MAELTLQKQATEILKKAQQVLVMVPGDLTLDAAASSLVIGTALERLGKGVTFLGPTGWPRAFERLSSLPPVVTRPGAAEYIVKLSGRELQIDELLLEPHDAGLPAGEAGLPAGELGYQIRLKLRRGEISPAALELERGPAQYDLIVSCLPLELGSLLTAADRLPLSQIPFLQISHLPPTAELPEALVFSEPNAASTSELMVGILEAIAGDQSLITKEGASLLLLGHLESTDHFRKAATTPKSLTVAAQLVAAGANKDLVFAVLQLPHSFATLKLWGRLLARLQLEKEAKLVWSYVTKEDLELSGASEVDVPRVIDELLLSLDQIEHVVILLQHQQRIVGFIRRAADAGDARELAERLLEPGVEISGDQQEAYLSLDGRLIDRGRELIAKLVGAQDTKAPTVVLP